MNNKIELYEPYQGFIRGNMFTKLFDQYGKVYDVKPMNEQAELLTYIDMFDFALIDLGIYLDVFPNNTNMLNLYHDILEKKIDVTNKYEEKFGPLTEESRYSAANKWNWLMNPWPWEV